MKDFVPNDLSWWNEAIKKAGGHRLRANETNRNVARLHIARALARAECAKARAMLRITNRITTI